MAAPEISVPPWEARLISALVFVTVIFALLPSGFSWKDVEDASHVVDGSIEVKLQWGSVFAVSFFVVARHRALALADLRATNPFLLAMFAYCALSVLWSPVDSVTIKKVIQFAGLIALALAVQADGRPWTHFVQVILSALTAIELASAITALVFPSQGIDWYFGYAWRGIVSGKNALGAIGALSVLIWVSLWQVYAGRRWAFWSGVVLSLLCVVMSKSSTSITIAALGLFSFWLLRKQHIGSRLWLLRLFMVAALIVLLATHLFFIQEGRLPERSEILEPFANLFGKSADLTGRSDIWEPLMVEIGKHWLLGIGYAAFWLGPGSPSQPILDTLPWIPFQAHNGYLDVLNELGAVGAVLFLGLIVTHGRHLFQLMRYDRPAAALFSSIFVTILFSNLTESSVFRGVTFPFLLMILTCVSVTTALRRRQWATAVVPAARPSPPIRPRQPQTARATGTARARLAKDVRRTV